MHDDRQKPLFVLLDGPVTVRLDIADILSKNVYDLCANVSSNWIFIHVLYGVMFITRRLSILGYTLNEQTN